MGDSPVSLDLTHGFNRIVDSWYQIFSSEVSTPMDVSACAYPAGWAEEQINDARNHSESLWSSLRWNQQQRPDDTMWATRYALNKLEWDLKVQWQGLFYAAPDYEHPDIEPPVYLFIENARASCDLVESASLSLHVHAAFGQPTFNDREAVLPVHFHVRCLDGDTTLRDEQRSFLISAGGERRRL